MKLKRSVLPAAIAAAIVLSLSACSHNGGEGQSAAPTNAAPAATAAAPAATAAAPATTAAAPASTAAAPASTAATPAASGTSG